MFLGLGVESKGREREGQEGRATPAGSRCFGSAVGSGEDSVVPEGRLATIAGTGGRCLTTLTYRHHTRAVLSSCCSVSSLGGKSPPCRPLLLLPRSVKDDAALYCTAQPADVTGSGKHQQPDHMLAQSVMQTG